jgi:type IV secretion system protein VirB11
MHFGPTDVLEPDATVRELIRPLFACLGQHPGATEVCVNRPGEVFVEVGAQWVRHEAPDVSLTWAHSLATAVATFTEQQISARSPILSAMLPGGERIQLVLPPAVEPGTVSISVRIPSAAIKPLSQYAGEGAFTRYLWGKSPDFARRAVHLSEIDRVLCQCLEEGDLRGFLETAVRERKNIAVVGDTGSGKTTLMKSLCQSIPPAERLITIEDVRELFLPHHPNRVHLLYARGGQGVARVSPADLIASNMRMKPDRVLLAELRGGEAFDFLKLLTTGHAGSITSFHAESCALAFERFVFMCKEHADAGVYDASSLKRLVALTIDVIVHVVARNRYDASGQPVAKDRFVAQVHFDPVAKLAAQFGEGELCGSGTAAARGGV